METQEIKLGDKVVGKNTEHNVNFVGKVIEIRDDETYLIKTKNGIKISIKAKYAKHYE